MTEEKNMFKYKTGEVFDFVGKQLLRTSEQISKNQYPRSTTNENKAWKLVDSSDWTSGFYPGCLWYAYEATGEKKLKILAQNYTIGLEKEKFNTSNHDIGFIILNSFGNGYRLTKDEHYKSVILTAANSLAKRYNPKIGCIRSWDFGTWMYPVIIDSIMNLELLFWAHKNGGSDELYDIAVKHADNILKNHLCEDGSIYHLVDYNLLDGKVISRETGSSKDAKVTWTRGHAWAIYGYSMVYRFTNDKRYLNAAKLIADNFINNLSEDYIPYWVVGERMHQKDSSAAAIAASGLLELFTYVETDEEKEKYKNTIVNILTHLISDKYYAKGKDNASILLQGMGGDDEINTGLIYGDYYFIEAILRLVKINSKSVHFLKA